MFPPLVGSTKVLISNQHSECTCESPFPHFYIFTDDPNAAAWLKMYMLWITPQANWQVQCGDRVHTELYPRPQVRVSMSHFHDVKYFLRTPVLPPKFQIASNVSRVAWCPKGRLGPRPIRFEAKLRRFLEVEQPLPCRFGVWHVTVFGTPFLHSITQRTSIRNPTRPCACIDATTDASLSDPVSNHVPDSHRLVTIQHHQSS